MIARETSESYDVTFSPITASRPNSSVLTYFKPGACSKPPPYPTPSRPTSTGAVVTMSASTRCREERNDCMTRAPPSTMTERMPCSRSVRRTAGRGRSEVAGGRSGSVYLASVASQLDKRRVAGRMVSRSTRTMVTPAANSTSRRASHCCSFSPSSSLAKNPSILGGVAEMTHGATPAPFAALIMSLHVGESRGGGSRMRGRGWW